MNSTFPYKERLFVVVQFIVISGSALVRGEVSRTEGILGARGAGVKVVGYNYSPSGA